MNPYIKQRKYLPGHKGCLRARLTNFIPPTRDTECTCNFKQTHGQTAFEVALMVAGATLQFWPSSAVWSHSSGDCVESASPRKVASQKAARPWTFYLTPDVSIAYNVRLESRGCGQDRLVI